MNKNMRNKSPSLILLARLKKHTIIHCRTSILAKQPKKVHISLHRLGRQYLGPQYLRFDPGGVWPSWISTQIWSTVLPLIIPAGIINCLPFFCGNYWRARIIRGRELLEVLKIYFFNYQFICIIEAFPDRFLISFWIFSHLKRSKIFFWEFFDCRSKEIQK